MRTAIAVQALALAATIPTPVGTRPWHHVASLVAVVAAAALAGRRLHSRAFVAVAVLATSVLAAVSGFALLYWKEGIRVAGLQDWGVFWHVAWSWAAAVLFWQHTWINRVAWWHFVRSSLRRFGPAVVHGGAYVAALAAFAWTATKGRSVFTIETYIPLSYWAWIVVAAAGLLLWLRGRRADHAGRRRWRGGVDLALVPVAAAAALSGVPLLFLDPQLDALGLKYASKFWHVAPSVLFCALVYAHSVQLWPAMRIHLRPRRLDAPSAQA